MVCGRPLGVPRFQRRSYHSRFVAPDYRVAGECLTLQLVAQSAHWFDWNKVWPEISRVLRPGGTTSVWVSNFKCACSLYPCLFQGYGEVTIPKYPYLKPLISDYHGGPDQLGIVAVS